MTGMIGDIRFQIRDVQYQEALISYDEVNVVSPLPKPTLNQLRQFAEDNRITFQSVIESPVGVYFFSRYLSKFANNVSLVEFHIQFLRISKLEDVPFKELDYLLSLAKLLPYHYNDDLAEIEDEIDNVSSRNKSLNERTSLDQVMLSYHEDELNLKTFHNLTTKIEQKTTGLFAAFLISEDFQHMMKVLWFAQKVPDPTDFQRFRILGKGAFGVVTGVKHKATGMLCAVKAMDKRTIKAKGAMVIIGAEKNVLQILGRNPSPFTVWLKFAFQDKDTFYMALPLCTGGDLAYHLERLGPFGIVVTRFYAAEIFDGLAHLHKLGIIYRDLKPENVILDASGHCRISDMGLAAVAKGKRLKGRAGTPGYWAPEVIIKGKHYGYKSDYWSLGVVIFECLIGICPMTEAISGMSREESTLKWKIRYPSYVYKGKSEDKIPVPEEVIDFLKGLLQRNEEERFSYEDIRKHKYFKPINWEKLRKLQLKPPFIPPEDEVNADNAQELESSSGTKQFSSVRLGKADELDNFGFISKQAFENEIVNTLISQIDEEEEEEEVLDTYFEEERPQTFSPFSSMLGVNKVDKVGLKERCNCTFM